MYSTRIIDFIFIPFESKKLFKFPGNRSGPTLQIPLSMLGIDQMFRKGNDSFCEVHLKKNIVKYWVISFVDRGHGVNEYQVHVLFLSCLIHFKFFKRMDVLEGLKLSYCCLIRRHFHWWIHANKIWIQNEDWDGWDNSSQTCFKCNTICLCELSLLKCDCSFLNIIFNKKSKSNITHAYMYMYMKTIIDIVFGSKWT